MPSKHASALKNTCSENSDMSVRELFSMPSDILRKADKRPAVETLMKSDSEHSIDMLTRLLNSQTEES